MQRNNLSYMNNNTFEVAHLIISAISALGSLIIAIMAIWGSRLILYFIRPKIKLTINTQSSCCIEKTTFNSEDSAEEESVIIRIKIINNGNTSAENASLLVENVLKENEDGEYGLYKEFATQRLAFDHDNSYKIDIIPELTYYVNVAIIRKLNAIISADEKSNSKQNYKLYLLTNNKEKDLEKSQLGKGTFIIPLKLYSDSLRKPVIEYLRMHWDSDTLNTKNLSCKIVPQRSFTIKK